MSSLTTLRDHLHLVAATLRRGSAPLFWVGVTMLGALGLILVGLLVDDRVITGAPAWMKPAKFAISLAIYNLTFAWLLGLLPRTRRRFAGWAGGIIAAVGVIELALIALQAARGTTSHFNNATLFDGAVFSIMGAAIAGLFITSAAVTVMLFRAPIADRTLAAAVRAGATISLAGASIGALMTRPTPAQMDDWRAGGAVTVVGAHTVGGPDGGPGLPMVGWSTRHGDLRVAHFLGLHAVQALPLLALLLRWRRVRASLPVVRVAAASYAALVVLLVIQALRGESVLAPGSAVAAALAAWLAASGAALAAAMARGRRAAATA
jgi:hypothetical protein